MRSLREVVGLDVYAKRRCVGRVGSVLFHPKGVRVIGFAVERPRLGMVIDLPDRYVALDAVTFDEGILRVAPERDSWDRAAEVRLDIDWDTTVVWQGMPVRTESGTLLGTVRDGVFSEKTGELNALGLSAGATRDLAVGVRDVAASMVVGFDGDSVRLRDAAEAVEPSGGAAAAAGKGAAVAKHRVGVATEAAAVAAGRGAAVAKQRLGEAAEVVGPAAKKAAAYGTAAVRTAAKSETARKATGWLKSLKDEVVDAMGAPDDNDKG